MFNDLTGSSQYVGNWPGVTVEKKEGRLRTHKDVVVTDLPGIYSLSPYTLEEVVTRNYILDEHPDVVIDLVDGSNIERNLYLTTQLTEMGLPVIIALNMIDIVQKNGDKIDVEKLSQALGCEVIETSAIKGTGSRQVAERAVQMALTGAKTHPGHTFSKPVEEALSGIESLIDGTVPQERLRWYSIKLFERDEKVLEKLELDADGKKRLEEIVSGLEAELDDDSESIITSERYQFIGKLVSQCVRKRQSGLTTSDKIDRVVTNRWLALPIFAAVMYIVYFVSVSWLGTIVTDWTNDTLFAETIQPAVGGWLEAVGAADWLQGLIVDGIIGGVGAVLGFVPQMFILFFFLSILEDCGYMARVAFIMDRIFRKFGLSGKSFIPMLISSGCGVPGIMATRTIENEKDRRMTIMTTTFIPCGAKLPIIALIAGAIFPNITWMAPATYFFGIFMVVISGHHPQEDQDVRRRPLPLRHGAAPVPLPRSQGRTASTCGSAARPSSSRPAPSSSWPAGSSGFCRASASAPRAFGMVEDENASLLAAIGGVIAPIFLPLGFGNWQAAVASVSGLVAKENVVGTFGVLFGLGEVGEDDPALLSLRSDALRHECQRPGFHGLQPDLRALLRGHRRHPAGDDERQVDLVRHRLHDGHGLRDGLHHQPAGRLPLLWRVLRNRPGPGPDLCGSAALGAAAQLQSQ